MTLIKWSGGYVALVLMVLVCLGMAAALSASPPNETPGKTALDDDKIARAIEAQLVIDDGVSAHLIDVSVTDGIADLSGSVSNVLAKERASKVARMVKGVRGVVNRLKVNTVPVEDATLLQMIEDALTVAPATDSYELEVTVEDGVVTLTGRVESRAEKNLAATVAKGVYGVRELRNKIGIHPTVARLEPQLEAEIEQRLRWDVRVDDALIEVEVDDGKAILTGAVGSADEKYIARSDAWVPGISEVDNSGLIVEPWAGDDRLRGEKYADKSDSEIVNAVEQALLYDPRVKAFHPGVSVEDGVVTLTGQVEDLAAKKAAEQTARNVVGVRRVKNHLRTRPSEMFDDETLAQRVRKRVERDPLLRHRNITVTSSNSKITLYGEVDTPYHKERAEDVVSNVKGVVAVDNRLSVGLESMEHKLDWEIVEDVRSELFWSPFVDSDEITVQVEDGVVTLTGTVDTWRERRAAGENATEGGAVAVHNLLQVKSAKGGG